MTFDWVELQESLAELPDPLLDISSEVGPNGELIIYVSAEQQELLRLNLPADVILHGKPVQFTVAEPTAELSPGEPLEFVEIFLPEK